jgi:hypothetical protein
MANARPDNGGHAETWAQCDNPHQATENSNENAISGLAEYALTHLPNVL